MSTFGSSTLPTQWEWATIREIGQVVSGGTPSTAITEYWGGPIAWISPSDLTGYKNKFISRGAKSITSEGLANSSARLMPEGSVHFSSRAPIGYTAISTNALCTNQGFKNIVPSKGVFNEYLYYYLKFIRPEAERRATGTTFKELSGTAFAALPVPIPPTAEQHRIVAKIEELFSELDKGIENLKLAKAQLAVYRQALLKHAFEGKLTSDITERNGHIPHDWTWQRLSQIADVSGGLTKNPRRESLPRKMKYLRVANVYADRLELDDVREIGVTNDEVERVSLQKGDLLVVEGNGSIEQIGRVAEWTGVVPDCGHQNHLIRARLRKGAVPRFVLRFLQSPVGRDTIIKAASSTSGLHTLSISKVGNIRIPVAPADQQQALLELLEPALDNVLALESEIESNLAKSEALRQSILKKAFAGELVPQDPNDEPASELLARIRAQRPAMGKQRNGKKISAVQVSLMRST